MRLFWLSSIMLLSVGCGSKTNPAANVEVSTPGPATPGDTPAVDVSTPGADTANTAAGTERDAAEARPDANAALADASPAAAADTSNQATSDATDAAADAMRDKAKVLVETWLGAQNSGDFDGYQALYGKRFTGVKRAGERTRRFDRARWLEDRKRMFSKVMKVEAKDLAIDTTDNGAIILFTQTWESGSFRDVGPKQIVAVVEDGQLRIAREEMLASIIEGGAGEVPDLAAGQYLPVVSSEGFLAVVRGPGDPDKTPHEAPESVVRAQVAFAKMKEQPAAPAKYELFGAAGKVCEVSAGPRGLVARARFHFGQVQTWDGTFDGLDPNKDKVDDKTVAADVMALASGGVHEVDRVDAAACAGATWAREAGAAPATVFGQVDATPFAGKAREALRKLPMWGQIQKDFQADDTIEVKTANWDEWESGVATSAWSAGGGAHFVAISVVSGTGCGTFGASAWATWRVEGDRWTLMTDGDRASDAMTPTSAFDADGDGRPEFTDGDELIQPVGATWKKTRSVKAPDFDCPC